MSLAADLFITPEEYLARERLAEQKSEYVNGRIYAMAGASPTHYRLTANLIGALLRLTDDLPCQVFSGDLRVHIPGSGMYTYPDVSVCCAESEDAAEGENLQNPTLLAEVLSPSTEAYDRADKWAHYQLIPSLQHYLLISQDRIRVECYTRQAGTSRWTLEVSTHLESAIELVHLGVALAVSDVYRKVRLVPGPGTARSPRHLPAE